MGRYSISWSIAILRFLKLFGYVFFVYYNTQWSLHKNYHPRGQSIYIFFFLISITIQSCFESKLETFQYSDSIFNTILHVTGVILFLRKTGKHVRKWCQIKKEF